MTEPLQSECKTCGGVVYAQRGLAGERRYTGVWLHLHQEDWQDNPHDALPQDSAARVVDLARMYPLNGPSMALPPMTPP